MEMHSTHVQGAQPETSDLQKNTERKHLSVYEETPQGTFLIFNILIKIARKLTQTLFADFSKDIFPQICLRFKDSLGHQKQIILNMLIPEFVL